MEDTILQGMKNKNKKGLPKLFIGVLGFEILLSEDTLKIKDEYTRRKYQKEWIPLDRAIQGFKNGIPVIEMVN